jgi:hypothetical protein
MAAIVLPTNPVLTTAVVPTRNPEYSPRHPESQGILVLAEEELLGPTKKNVYLQ